ncbi:TPA: winged helix-turn-helix transcriptional regulator [Enterococcus faecium]|nr:winged helix-turn-helix transcriptional regulator [Enterococcus faecium]HAQ0628423.1 winged helix-turn-helix transcriptional regulator [Enterococcus faecium]
MEEYKPDLTNESTFSGISIFPAQRRILVEGNEIYLTHHEFETLLFLTRHPEQVFTKRQIYEAVWDDIPISVDAKVECMVYSIRKKLKAYTDRQYIQTVWGVGYKFDPEM